MACLLAFLLQPLVLSSMALANASNPTPGSLAADLLVTCQQVSGYVDTNKDDAQVPRCPDCLSQFGVSLLPMEGGIALFAPVFVFSALSFPSEEAPSLEPIIAGAPRAPPVV